MNRLQVSLLPARVHSQRQRQIQRQIRIHRQLRGIRWQTTQSATTSHVHLTHTTTEPDAISDATILNKNAFISTITLNRPKAANAFGRDMIHQLSAILDTEQLLQSRCVILTSSVPNIFSAGADLKERAKMTSLEEVECFVHLLQSTMERIASLPMPTIAVMNGIALGGGLELALATDVRIASPTATMGFPETSLAILPGAGGTQRLARLIGVARAKELIFTGQHISAQHALEYGIVQYVVQDADQKATELAKLIAKNGPIAVQAAKEAINRGLEKATMAEALEVERICYAKVLPTKDRLEGLAAFQQGRCPHYTGK